MPKKSGFTLIELLVVISMLGILATFVFINFKTANSDQTLNKAALEIQTLLKLAQSNATTSTLCKGESGKFWSVNITSKTHLEMTCNVADSAKQNLDLENAEISSFQCSPAAQADCPPTSGNTFNPPLSISYSPLYGVTSFDGASCASNAATIMVVLTNSKNKNTKCFTISKGGAVDLK